MHYSYMFVHAHSWNGVEDEGEALEKTSLIISTDLDCRKSYIIESRTSVRCDAHASSFVVMPKS